MKKTAILLTSLAVVAVMVLLWQALHEELVVTGQGVRTVPAEEQADQYNAWVAALKNRQFAGFEYAGSPDTAQVQFAAYTLRLRNPGLFVAETVEIQLVSEPQDIAAYQEPSFMNIAPGREGTLTLTLLTDAKTPLRRDLVITYYVLGRLKTMRYTLY